MKVGITGSPQAGKTTLFRLLTGVAGSKPGSRTSSIGVMEVPDERVRILSEIYNLRKTTYARIDLADIQVHKGQEFLNGVRNLDTLVVVLGCFMDEPGVKDSLDFIDNMETEFCCADLASVESRLERLKLNKAKPVNQMEIPFLEKCKEALDREVPLRDIGFLPHELNLVSNFAFYSSKTVILAPNIAEEHLTSGSYPGMEQISKIGEDRGYKVVPFSGTVEEEIESLDEESRTEFLNTYGITQPGTARIAQAAYEALGLISFFTVNADEVRAWTIRLGTRAKEAAGKIHSDMERGFIKAEVVSFDDFSKVGSVKECRDKGLIRLEGKDYVVKDGDIVHIRFNV
ncbi:MAG TPA: redox-regulated ATPase YchF [Firmicutes bacterium]|nr:redox-regulated ATPase YchF [Bacillota bacterium]